MIANALNPDRDGHCNILTGYIDADLSGTETRMLSFTVMCSISGSVCIWNVIKVTLYMCAFVIVVNVPRVQILEKCFWAEELKKQRQLKRNVIIKFVTLAVHPNLGSSMSSMIRPSNRSLQGCKYDRCMAMRAWQTLHYTMFAHVPHVPHVPHALQVHCTYHF